MTDVPVDAPGGQRPGIGLERLCKFRLTEARVKRSAFRAPVAVTFCQARTPERACIFRITGTLLPLVLHSTRACC